MSIHCTLCANVWRAWVGECSSAFTNKKRHVVDEPTAMLVDEQQPLCQAPSTQTLATPRGATGPQTRHRHRPHPRLHRPHRPHQTTAAMRLLPTGWCRFLSTAMLPAYFCRSILLCAELNFVVVCNIFQRIYVPSAKQCQGCDVRWSGMAWRGMVEVCEGAPVVMGGSSPMGTT